MSDYAYRDLLGQRFGRLTVIRKTTWRKYNGSVVWECRCDCGGTASVPSVDLVTGNTVSCGCRQAEVRAANARALAARWAAWEPGEQPPACFRVPAGHIMTITQQRNWQREITRVRRFEARRETEWLAQHGQRRERVA